MIDSEKYDRKLLDLGYNPLKVLCSGGSLSEPQGRAIFEDAIGLVSCVGCDLLSPLLQKKDSLISTNALYIFSELGGRGKLLINEVMVHIDHEDPSARWYLLDGLLSHLPLLSNDDLVQVIKKSGDKSVRVRKKAIEIIASLPSEKLDIARTRLKGSEFFESHNIGLSLFFNNVTENELINLINADDDIVSCYALAYMLKKEKSGIGFDSSNSKFHREEALYIRQKIDLLRKKFNGVRLNLP